MFVCFLCVYVGVCGLGGGGGKGECFFGVCSYFLILAVVSHSGAVMVVVSPWGHWVG